MLQYYCSSYQLHSTSLETITPADRHHNWFMNNNWLYKSALHHDNIVTWCCDMMGPSYTKKNKQILKARENVGFMNQSKLPTEPYDCRSQPILVKRSRERLIKSLLRITDIRSRRTVAVKGLISCLLRRMHN